MAGASAQFRGSKVIEKQDVLSAVAQMSKLSENFLNQSDHERFLKMEKELPEQVLGQPGIQKVVDGLVGSRSGLTDPDQPWGCFVLQGPSGTGKTEFCKALARYLFGSEASLIKLDMSEYSQEHTVARLIGAPPGYVGFDSAEPALTERIRQQPYSILLLDEIEKAHPKVFDIFLSVLNDGKMQDNHGKTVLFNNVIIIMTSNLGAKNAINFIQGKSGIGFGGTEQMSEAEQEERLAEIYAKERKSFFRPEMVNRIEELGGFVTWVPLSEQVISKLVDREISKVSARMGDSAGAGIKGVTLEVSDDVKAEIAKAGYDPTMGARPLRKVVREKISNPLGKWLMGNKEELLAFISENGGAKIVINTIGGAFKPEIAKLASTAPSNDNGGSVAKAKKQASAPDV
jgi:ATP-dependent Clp protease ATP-binding subunit ClpA